MQEMKNVKIVSVQTAKRTDHFNNNK